VKAEAGPGVQAQPAAAEAAPQQAGEAPAHEAAGADAAAAAAGAAPSGTELPQPRRHEEWRWRLLSSTVLPSELAPAAMPGACTGVHSCVLPRAIRQHLWHVG
jgi:hypothetical protein